MSKYGNTVPLVDQTGADIVLPIEDYNKLLNYYRQKGAEEACQVHSFDGLIEDLHQLTWLPYSGKVQYLAEFCFQEQSERSTFVDIPGQQHAYLEVRIDPGEENFDIYALCLCNAIIIDLQPLLRQYEGYFDPHKTWLADIKRRWTSKALKPGSGSTKETRALKQLWEIESGEKYEQMRLPAPLNREEWKSLLNEGLYSRVKGIVTKEWKQASRKALEFAYKMDREVMAAGGVSHSPGNLAKKKLLDKIMEKARAAAFEGEILDDYLVGLLPKGSRNVTFKDVKTGKIAKHLKEKQAAMHEWDEGQADYLPAAPLAVAPPPVEAEPPLAGAGDEAGAGASAVVKTEAGASAPVKKKRKGNEVGVKIEAGGQEPIKEETL